MDRWIKSRDELSKKLEDCKNKYEAVQNGDRDETTLQELKDQLEAHTLHMDYIQENIDNCQGCIIEMEVNILHVYRRIEIYYIPIENHREGGKYTTLYIHVCTSYKRIYR